MTRMFTTCPNCTLNLAVTPADLRVGQGYVRCGRCERVFNALIALTEDIEVERQSGLAATGTASVPALNEEPQGEPQLDQSFQDLQLVEDDDLVETIATGTFETIVLEGDGYLQTEEHVEESLVQAQLQQVSDQLDADQFAHVRAELGVEEYTNENVTIEDMDSAYSPEIEADAALFPVQAKSHWGWLAAGIVLALMLAGQIIHHHRQSLVTQGWAQPLLTPTYAAMGVTLEPQWDLNAYDVRQLGGEALPGAAEKIVLRASIQNTSDHSQPPPLLRITLQDRFGNSLAAHDIAPQEYLRGTALSRLKANQRVDAQLSVDDPEKKAVGFEIYACLPSAACRVLCAGQP
jgi:predicted Zn finger-like uncharacterized protein